MEKKVQEIQSLIDQLRQESYELEKDIEKLVEENDDPYKMKDVVYKLDLVIRGLKDAYRNMTNITSSL